ncbi:hypothetical protein GGS21DRAFT_327728 [Xylaria nigripes]|nr:hypothetical protein GGS21DRAFT_327728 [Xylaria nigripes]
MLFDTSGALAAVNCTSSNHSAMILNTATKMVRVSFTLLIAALLRTAISAPVERRIPTELSTGSQPGFLALISFPEITPEDTQKHIPRDLVPDTTFDTHQTDPTVYSHLMGPFAAFRWFRWLPFDSINSYEKSPNLINQVKGKDEIEDGIKALNEIKTKRQYMGRREIYQLKDKVLELDVMNLLAECLNNLRHSWFRSLRWNTEWN